MREKMCECKTCKQQIARSAKVCPNCGAKNKKGNPLLIGVIVIVALIVIVSAAGGSDEPVKVGDVGGNSGITNNDPKDSKTSFGVGEIAELKDVQATLLSVTESDGSDFNKPADGKVFVICEFEISNNSEEEINISSMMSFEAYCDDYTCTYSLGALLEKEDKNQLDGSVAPGKKFNGVIGYEVPADWEELEIHFTPDIMSSKEIVFLAKDN